jgi:hypothetical protein
LHELFAVKDFVDPKAWDITEIKWKDVLSASTFPPEIRKIIGYMPECIPFEVRATLFQQTIKADLAKNQHREKLHVKVRRTQLFQDGYQAFMKVPDLK